jgi:hypothetical protein
LEIIEEMAANNECPICKKRKGARFCPALGQTICAICCGTEREVTIDCPADCAYLISAHRYEAKHGKPINPAEIPFRDVSYPPDLIHEFRPVVSGLAYAVVKGVAENPSATDADALAALQAITETYRTLGSGLYYEKPPAGGPPQAIYASLAKFLDDFKQRAGESGAPRVADSKIFSLLVFLFRVGKQQTNGRPRARIFLEFLRTQFPKMTQPQAEPSRIIMP